MAMKNKNFGVLILTHGRPDNVITVETLRKSGYTGKIYFVVDDEDSRQQEYLDRFGDMVVIFSKDEIGKTFDKGDNFGDKRTITFARNASWKVAEKLGLKYFIQLDDDYTNFDYRFNDRLEYQMDIKYERIKNLDGIFDAMLDFYKSVPAVTIAMAQGGDFIGGGQGRNAQGVRLMRKCMNSFICSVDRPLKFRGTFNEDVNTYVSLGNRGLLFFTVNNVSLTQKATQSSAGGITDLYLKFGTFVKSFMTVM